MRNQQAYINLRGQDVTVNCTMAPADPEVGIMEEYINSYETFGPDGVLLSWDLTDDELDTVYEYLNSNDDFDDLDDDIADEDFEEDDHA